MTAPLPHVEDGSAPVILEPQTGNYFVSTYPPFSTWMAGQVSAVQRLLKQPLTSPSQPTLGLYVHIPFCVHRCDYCYYLSYAGRSVEDMDDYVDCLIREIGLYRQAPAFSQRALSFAYFGGGTPSLLSERQISRLMATLHGACLLDRVEEATFECAPKSVTEQKLRLMRDSGITRISLGIQELNDYVLQCSGRIHSVRDCERAYEAIRKVGFDVLNVDLIVGLVGQTDESFMGSLDHVIGMQPECVTIYQLEIPHNTRLFHRVRDGRQDDPLVDWNVKRARLAGGFERLERAGYTVRSAYAAVRDPARHRFVYQDAQYRGADLLGIGASAFSYLGSVHFQNIASLNEYRMAVSDERLPINRAYVLGDDERLIREFILQLKLGAADATYFRNKFGVDVFTRFADPLARLRRNGWLTIDDHAVRMTRPGLLCVDRLLPGFYLSHHRQVRYS